MCTRVDDTKCIAGVLLRRVCPDKAWYSTPSYTPTPELYRRCSRMVQPPGNPPPRTRTRTHTHHPLLSVTPPPPHSDVTVLGAGGKTGRECVEYLAARGTGKSSFLRACIYTLACVCDHGLCVVTVAVPSLKTGIRSEGGGTEFDQQRGGAAGVHDRQGGHQTDGGCHGAQLAPRGC